MASRSSASTCITYSIRAAATPAVTGHVVPLALGEPEDAYAGHLSAGVDGLQGRVVVRSVVDDDHLVRTSKGLLDDGLHCLDEVVPRVVAGDDEADASVRGCHEAALPFMAAAPTGAGRLRTAMTVARVAAK